jgi:hypothetical protein
MWSTIEDEISIILPNVWPKDTIYHDHYNSRYHTDLYNIKSSALLSLSPETVIPRKSSWLVQARSQFKFN